MADASLSTFQQEVDVLRGQLGTLRVTGIWTSKDPPKFTGIFGTLLQDELAGVFLIRAFTRLHMAAEANRTNAYTILTLVQNYRSKLDAEARKQAK